MSDTTRTSPPTPEAAPVREPAHRYTGALAGRIEQHWQAHWEEHGTFVTSNPGDAGFDASRPKYYVLDMFPYPSGAGLHVGHPEGYTATDIVARFMRMRGFNVLHPMGFDAFGLPAEQYAISTGVHPAVTTRQAMDTFRQQLKRFGFSYDWSRELATMDEDYYRWTQWIWLKAYHCWYDPRQAQARPVSELRDALDGGTRTVEELAHPEPGRKLTPWAEMDEAQRRAFIDDRRLAYIDEQMVNWCPKLGTALANEEVISGRSERGGHPVYRKPLRQWMFRITAYADRLLEDLDRLVWPDSTHAMQIEWIGRSEGAEIDFPLVEAPTVPRLSEPRRPQTAEAILQAVDDAFDPTDQYVLRSRGFAGRDPFPPGETTPNDLKYSKRNLPHIELRDATYFVSWRCERNRSLADPDRDVVLEALSHGYEDRCHVYAACVLPDHVHWIVRPHEGVDLAELVSNAKRFTARKVNRRTNVRGSLWNPERFDHVIRDERWMSKFVVYVALNAMRAGLVARPSAYAWTFIDESVRAPEGQPVMQFVDALAERSAGGNIPEHGSERRGTSGGVTPEHGSERRGTPGGITPEHGSERRGTSALRVYTTRPDTLFGATYMVVAPEHPLVDAVLADPPAGADPGAIRAYVEQARHRSDVDRMTEAKEKTGVFLGVQARNPATGKDIPVWAADYVLMGYGHGAIMAVPAHDQRDHDFARTFDLPITQVVRNDDAIVDIRDAAYPGEGVGMHSANEEVSLDGLPTAEAKARITTWLESTRRGRGKVNYRLRDWLFSRQRYWGEPIPVVFDAQGRHHPVDEAHLPVTLPDLADYQPIESDDPQPLLAKATDWLHTTAGAAGVSPDRLPPDAPVTREANTMPGWAGSCWYYLRFCDPKSAGRFVGADAEHYWMAGPPDDPERHLAGVDLYIGGAEHAVLHLLYARFWHKILFDLGEVSTPEPFGRLFHQGMIISHAFQRADESLVPVDEVETRDDGTFIEIAGGEPVTRITAKMSKSLRNVVNPDEIIQEYGADTFRLYEMSMGPLEATKPWNTRDIVGVFRFLQRAWRLAVDEETGQLTLRGEPDDAVERALHRTTAKVGADMERLAFNTAIASMIEFVNAATAAGGVTRDQLDRFTRVLAPFAPHMAEALWSKLGRDDSIAFAPWPAHDEAMLRDETLELPVQVMGKVRGHVTVPADADEAHVREAALAVPAVAKHLEGRTVRKVIVVKGKIVNIVAG